MHKIACGTPGKRMSPGAPAWPVRKGKCDPRDRIDQALLRLSECYASRDEYDRPGVFPFSLTSTGDPLSARDMRSLSEVSGISTNSVTTSNPIAPVSCQRADERVGNTPPRSPRML